MNRNARIRAVIVDDEALAREGIRLRLERAGDFLVVGEFDSAVVARTHIQALKADVWFLDVRMPRLTGLELLAHNARTAPLVVFVTAFGDHALDAFGARAIDYVLKPYDDDRFAETMTRIRKRVAEQRDGSLGRRVRSAMEQGTGTASGASRLPVRTRNGVSFVRSDAIDWLEANRDLVRVHVGAATHLIRETLSNVHRTLDGRRFVRVHRSAVVNLDRIAELQPYFHGEYIAILSSGARVKVSRTRRAYLARALGLKAR